jgi:hypothetical protein
MGILFRAIAIAMLPLLLAGCFGYNRSAKRWAYVGDTVLLLSGGGAVALDVTSKPEPCMGDNCVRFTPPFGGAMVAGVLLASAGIIGILFNATRGQSTSTQLAR